MPHAPLVSHLPHRSLFEECTHRATCISLQVYSAVLRLPDSDNQSQEQAIESIPPLCRHCRDLALTARRQPCHRSQPQVKIREPVACCFGSFPTSPASQTVPSLSPPSPCWMRLLVKGARCVTRELNKANSTETSINFTTSP